jgi:hypothetical protein
MNVIDEEQLKLEIAHIFESGANEIRILEMVKSFIDVRNKKSDYYLQGYKDGWRDCCRDQKEFK